jgi:signal peptidase II
VSEPAASTDEKTGSWTSRKTVLFLGVAALWVVVDQLTKRWIQNNLVLGRDRVPVIDGFFELVHVENTGAAFGMLSDQWWAMWLFIPFTILAALVLLSMLRDVADAAIFEPLVLASIFGGACGNFLDRVRSQGVTDFLRVYLDAPALGGIEWPSFNVADIGIVIGVTLFIGHELFGSPTGARAQTEPAQEA